MRRDPSKPVRSSGASMRDWGSLLTFGLGAYALAFVVWVSLDWGDGALKTAIGDLAFLPVSFSAALLALRAARRVPADTGSRRAWTLIASAFACLLAGDALWSILELALNIAPFPSVADPFYLAFYPLMLAGLLSLPVVHRSAREGLRFALDSSTVLLGGGMLVWYFVLRPLTLDGEPPLSAALLLAYPVGDLVLIFGIASVLLRRPDTTSRATLWVLAAGVGVFVLGDLGYGALSVQDAYQSGDWPDALWMVGQFLLAAAAHVQLVAIARRRKPEPDREVPRDRPFSILPYVAIVAGYALLFVVARPEASSTVGGLLIGAVALTTLVVARQVTVMMENARLVAELRMLARTDALTGMFTRRAFFELAEREWARAVRHGHPLTALALDVDFFKSVNDAHGHAVGDAVLACVADRFRTALRDTDVIGRIGGDEFVALLPDTPIDETTALVERLRSLMTAPVVTPHGPVRVTVSIGVTGLSDCGSLSQLIERADGALYVAKESGRDRVHALVG